MAAEHHHCNSREDDRTVCPAGQLIDQAQARPVAAGLTGGVRRRAMRLRAGMDERVGTASHQLGHRQQRQEGQHGNDGNVLEQQNGKARLPALALGQTLLVQCLQDNRRR